MVRGFCEGHGNLDENLAVRKPADSGWTVKQIVGHLIDSAANNHQRITRLQADAELRFPPYDGGRWQAAENWNAFGWREILNLFEAYNLFLVHLIRNVGPENLGHRWFGRDRFGERTYTLEEMIVSYRDHLKEHLDQVEATLEKIRSQP
jgi:hypothetical protein